jgi:5,10-methylenetetrahydrofolate reductase
MSGSFEIIWELDPPTRPDLTRLHDQLNVLNESSSTFLVPDNHTGRATVSSIAVAAEVQRWGGGRAIACINARDRNLLGFRRDLLTSALHGIEEVLLVYGDEPEVGERSGGLTVRSMLDECRSFVADSEVPVALRVSATSRLRPLPRWKADVDRLFVQVCWSVDDLLRWRESLDFDGPVYPAVLVVPSAGMARRLGDRIPELRMPDELIDAVERDPGAGIDIAGDLVDRIEQSGAFAGVHLIAGHRYRQVAAALEGRTRALPR